MQSPIFIVNNPINKEQFNGAEKKNVYVFHGDIDIKGKLEKSIKKIVDKKDNIIYISETIFLDDNIRTVKQKLYKFINEQLYTSELDYFLINDIFLTGTCKKEIDFEILYDTINEKKNRLFIIFKLFC